MNQVISKRFCTRQRMPWSPHGRHLLLQIRTRGFNGDWEATWRSGFWSSVLLPSRCSRLLPPQLGSRSIPGLRGLTRWLALGRRLVDELLLIAHRSTSPKTAVY
jgi:hypothetical protein